MPGGPSFSSYSRMLRISCDKPVEKKMRRNVLFCLRASRAAIDWVAGSSAAHQPPGRIQTQKPSGRCGSRGRGRADGPTDPAAAEPTEASALSRLPVWSVTKAKMRLDRLESSSAAGRSLSRQGGAWRWQAPWDSLDACPFVRARGGRPSWQVVLRHGEPGKPIRQRDRATARSRGAAVPSGAWHGLATEGARVEQVGVNPLRRAVVAAGVGNATPDL